MANQEITHLENRTAGYPVARTSNPDWSLRVYTAPDLTPSTIQTARSSKFVIPSLPISRPIWRNLAIASAVGLCAGFLVASFRMPNGGTPFAAQPPAVSAPAPAVSRTDPPMPAVLPSPSSSPSTPVAAPAAKKLSRHSAYLPPEEVARLKTRNRRLEALVEVLRNRKTQNAPLPLNSAKP